MLFLIALLALLVLASPAQAAPVMHTPEAQLRAALRCQGERPLLLVPGTSETPRMFDWNWARALDSFCTVELPEAATGDLQVHAEYVAYAIRSIHARTGRRVQVVGHSQGGMLPRWVLKHWEDTRAMVDDLVGLAPSNHGTDLAIATCEAQGGCPASNWQQRSDARFIAALNQGGETFPGISYTSAFTRYDQIVIPAESAALDGGTNIRIQDLCPANAADHLAMGTYDPVAHAIALDALSHDGPADPARVDRAACSRAFMPGVDQSAFLADYGAFLGDVGNATGSAPAVPEEPPLRRYDPGTRLDVAVAPRRIRRGRSTRVRVRASSPGVVELFGKRLAIDGRVTLKVRSRQAGTVKVRVISPMQGVAERTVRVVR